MSKRNKKTANKRANNNLDVEIKDKENINVDVEILKALLFSDDPALSISHTDDSSQLFFPISDNLLIDRLSKSISSLVSCNISRQTYQRYSVRLHAIEVLRDFCQLSDKLGYLRCFADGEQTLKFFISLLGKNLKSKILVNINEVDKLVHIAKTITILAIKETRLKQIYPKVIKRIIELEQSESSLKFLNNILNTEDYMKVSVPLSEKIYKRQSIKLIDDPLEKSFATFIKDPNDKNIFMDNKLFINTVDKPALFQLISKKLKDLFLQTNYDEKTLDFIKCVLKKVELQCSSYGKDMLDLYPVSIQYCVVLLRIKPTEHSENSKKYALDSLKKIFMTNHNNAYILISHFPDWISPFLDYIRN